jgi:hypothetical protein
MADDALPENRHFEQVLHRLDALMKRNQGSSEAADIMPGPPTFVILPPPEETWSDAGEISTSADTLGVGTSDAIPLLTEIFHGDLPAASPSETSGSSADVLVKELLPPLLSALDSAIQQETARMREALSMHLEQQIADMLQQHLHRTGKPS